MRHPYFYVLHRNNRLIFKTILGGRRFSASAFGATQTKSWRR
jgi:hypothetical protein